MLRAGGTLILLAGAAAAGIFWYQRGPGLEREVERLVAAAGVRPGTTATEIGAGSGRMAVLAAQHLGAGGFTRPNWRPRNSRRFASG